MSDRYGVMGNPIGHSKSPFIHAAFARATAQDLIYEAIEVELDGFVRAVQEFAAAGGRGLNVTVPFKPEAWSLSHSRAPRAERAGAVNTLIVEPDGQLRGDNTDGAGLVRDLVSNEGVAIGGRRVLMLGAGGAARGVLEPLLDEAPADLAIVNRTHQRAVILAGDFARAGKVRAMTFEELVDEPWDLVINATSASLQGEALPLPEDAVSASTVCYDMMYGAELTPFLKWARDAGAGRLLDGTGMLVEQAAESFWLWRGVRPPTGPVIESLRSLLGGQKVSI